MKIEHKTIAEFFAGIGLMRMGLDRAGWHTVWANDIDPDKVEMYRHHFRDNPDPLVQGDVHLLDSKLIPTVTLATASFPCTDLSLAGARRGLAGAGSGAFWGFVDALKSMGARRPPMVLLENVTGFLTSHNGEDFRNACLALNDLGYAVDAFIIDAVHFVPQSRQRLFVVGTTQTGSARVSERPPSFFEGNGRPAALSDFIMMHPDISWKIRELPPLPKRKKQLSDLLESYSANSAIWWSTERAEYLLSQMSPRHREIADEMINGKETSYGTVFRRVRQGRSMAELRVDGIAGCLRTPRGGSGRQILFAAGNGRFGVRLLTARECSRLMGAGEFRMSEKLTLNKALFGFGDAVCVSVVEWIAKNYFDPLLSDFEGAENPKTVAYGKPA